MPTISTFYGILVLMFFDDAVRHHQPHIHVRYQGKRASIAIESGKVLAGKLPRKQLRLIQAWIEIHQEELNADWEMAIAGQKPRWIDPLQ